MDDKKPVLLYIMVVGFHHKKGCQVEFSYPPLVTKNGECKNECPNGWKYLPTLALPDGSHNFMEDSIFFNLPSLDDPNESVFGVSCFRQISVEKLKKRTADVTRSTVQKSVCALISIPIYGYIEVKLSLIAHAFFDQGDFSSVSILIDAYKNFNACLLSGQMICSPLKQICIGLPLRDLILKWRHKILLLFKLFLLQKRVICFGSPVRPICSLVLGIASLHPLLLEQGFQKVACVRTSRPMSPMPDFSKMNEQEIGQVDKIVSNTKLKSSNLSNNSLEIGNRSEKNTIPRDASVDALASASFLQMCTLNASSWKAPLQIFQHGNLCLPYLSLPYMDLLSDPSVLGYVIGTSNILFQQKKQLADVLIEVEGGIMETQDQELRRQLQLTTEDLRFIDFVIRHVTNPKEEEGSELWIREQFQGYMLAMLKTSLLPDTSKEVEHFNGSFMNAWKNTLCYQEWYDHRPENFILESIPNGHPFAGTLSVADMKLRLSQTMHNTESGRKLNQAVNHTSRAVGGALSQAKGALSNWWSSITTTSTLSHTIDESCKHDDQLITKNKHDIEIVMEKEKINNNINHEQLEEKIVVKDETEILDANCHFSLNDKVETLW